MPRSHRIKRLCLPKTLRSVAHDHFIQLIQAARKQAGLTQVDVSKILGVRQSFISDVERGERRLDIIEFLHFCRAYRIKPGRFLEKLAKIIAERS